MSLAFTAPSLASHYTVLSYKVRYLFADESSKYEAWYAGLGSPTPDQTTLYEKFSGKTMSIIIERGFLPSFQTNFNYEYQTKMSGACFVDYSSGVGGFCLLEDNDNAMTASSTAVTDFYAGTGPYTLTGGSEVMKTFRSAKSVFDTFDDLWTTEATVLTSAKQDGRIYYRAVLADLVDEGTTEEYLDYPSCTLTNDATGNFF